MFEMVKPKKSKKRNGPLLGSKMLLSRADALIHISPEIRAIPFKQSLQRLDRNLGERRVAGQRQMRRGAGA
jgi:hypothetical protein